MFFLASQPPYPLSQQVTGPEMTSYPCTCRKLHPCRSGRVFVLVQDAVKSVVSADGEVSESPGVLD